MYKFPGNSNSIRPESLHFSKSRPRNAGMDPLANSINQMAEDRFHPTTATKKFKNQQGYPSVDTYPPYNPYAAPAAETYSSNGGKTSYDSDASQYMIKNPVDMDSSMGDGMPVKTSDTVSVPKNPMKDYMTQNEPLDIKQSYSYEVPQPQPQPAKNPKMRPSGSAGPWEQPPDDPEPEHGPLYYPWKAKPTMKPPPPEEEEEEPVGPVYYPWMSPPKKMKLKPPPPPEPEDDSQSPQEWDMDPPPKSKPKSPKGAPPVDDSALYYPLMSYGPPKKSKPAQVMMEDEDAPDDNDASSWGMKPPSKSKPPKDDMGPPPDDHIYPYSYYGDHDHGVVYHDDHHKEEEEPEEDHPMKDEDRESKRPYTYYHLGRKLWYVPLLFSLYFIVYIASLILKSIARHKVELPEKLWELNDHHHHDHHDEHSRRNRKIEDATRNVYDSLDKAKNKFM